MFEHSFIVKYLTTKNCFCYLSSNNYKSLQKKEVKLNCGQESTFYFSVASPTILISPDCIGISSLYAKLLEIDENSTVLLTEINKLPTIGSLTITTLNKDDHEVLELLAHNVQSTLLDQIRVLNNNQKIVIWIGNGISINVNVCNIKPISPGCIDNLTEVVIQQPNFKTVNGDDKKDIIENGSLSGVKSLLDILFSSQKKLVKNQNESDILEELMIYEDNVILRVVQITNLIQDKIKKYYHPFNVFVFRSDFPLKCLNTLENCVIFSLTSLDKSEQDCNEKMIYVKLCIFEDFFSDFQIDVLSFNNLFISQELYTYFNMQIGAKVKMQRYQYSLPIIDEIEIFTNKNSFTSDEIIENFKRYLGNKCFDLKQFILNPNVVFDIGNNVKCSLKFQPISSKFSTINEDFVRNCKFSATKEILHIDENSSNTTHVKKKYITNVANYEEIINSVLEVFYKKINAFECFLENNLIIGKPGSGKTILLKIISKKLTSFPNYIFVKVINCKSIKGKTIESLHKLFLNAFSDLIYHEPSVLILDDLHVLCKNVNDEADAIAQNALYYNRVSEMLYNMLYKFWKNYKIGILASAESTIGLNLNIYSSRGSHLFKNLFSIDDFDKNDRKKMLEFLFSSYQTNNIDFDKLSLKTESFVVQDIVDFASRVIYESYKNDDKNEINSNHCDKALKNTPVLSLQDINLHSPGSKDFSDIGGLNDIKKLLIENLSWPVKYPDIFTNAPLRLPSGLLLYGPPGTGKTLLAGAAAKHCGLRLISIKGPELLSKYIGASEQAVRNVFQKAQSCKPCILFFDEFDSLAPRRGHDNTGVTDRVVNQLLTQLDGIESLSGVCVLAATSRPDLLDPALLRPGRLDKQILCSLPNQNSRLEILIALSKSMIFSNDVDLSVIAEQSDGFSGADLQSVLYTAHLTAVENLLTEKSDIVTMKETKAEINQKQLEDALEKTRPSLSREEKIKYEKIYYKFQGGIMDDFKTGGKTTLA